MAPNQRLYLISVPFVLPHRQQAYQNRSQAIEEALKEKLKRLDRSRLAREVAKLDSEFERTLAEEGLSKDLSEWPEY